MESSKRQRAIIQAQASLKIDRIYLKPNYIANYIRQSTSPKIEGPKLTLKRGVSNGTNR